MDVGSVEESADVIFVVGLFEFCSDLQFVCLGNDTEWSVDPRPSVDAVWIKIYYSTFQDNQIT
jgi:hypothetical protein